jgi:competence protein ComEC
MQPPRPAAASELARLELPGTARGTVVGHWLCEEEACRGPFALRGFEAAGQLLSPVPALVTAQLYGAASVPAAGTELRLRGTLRSPTRYRNRLEPPPGRWQLVVKSRLLVEELAPAHAWGSLSHELRGRVEATFAAVPPSSGTALARALLLGDSSGLPDPWLRAFKRLGLFHLLAISGAHLALFTGLVWWSCALPVRAPRRGLRLLLVGAALLAFLLVAGPLPSLLRASAMAALVLLARALGRPALGANALAGGSLLLLVLEPPLLHDLGFQLSALATAGLLLVAPLLEERWTWGPVWLRRLVAATVAAELLVLPISLPAFRLLPIGGVLLDPLFVPWASLGLGLAAAWVGLAALAPPLGRALVPVLDLWSEPCRWLADLPPEVPLAVPHALPLSLAGTLAALVLGGLLRPRWGRWVLLGGLAWFASPAPPADEVELVVLDVGQGEALLLKHGRRGILIDGGGLPRGDLGGRVVLPALLGEGVRRLDAIVLSHGDLDHCGGLLDLTSYLPVGELWAAAPVEPVGCEAELRAWALARGRLRLLEAGQARSWGPWRLAVLAPLTRTAASRNDASLVLRAEARGRSFLLTGDIGAAAEAALAARWGAELATDVLKVPHHGSNSSSTLAFLVRNGARYALISAGSGNRYGHPGREAMRRLEWSAQRVLSTHADGWLAVRVSRKGSLSLRRWNDRAGAGPSLHEPGDGGRDDEDPGGGRTDGGGQERGGARAGRGVGRRDRQRRCAPGLPLPRPRHGEADRRRARSRPPPPPRHPRAERALLGRGVRPARAGRAGRDQGSRAASDRGRR